MNGGENFVVVLACVSLHEAFSSRKQVWYVTQRTWNIKDELCLEARNKSVTNTVFP